MCRVCGVHARLGCGCVKEAKVAGMHCEFRGGSSHFMNGLTTRLRLLWLVLLWVGGRPTLGGGPPSP